MKGGCIVSKKKDKVNHTNSQQVADEMFKIENKNNENKNDAVKGIEETHKQVTDHYFEGTIEQKLK